MIYLFDSNIVLHYIRQSAVMMQIERDFNPFGPDNESWLCVVSKGELRSIAIQNQWGALRRQQLEDLMNDFYPADIFSEEMIDAYAEIDAFSQGRLPNKSLSMSARNMGKNDLWIAATAHVLGAKLLITDADFNHLNGVFLDLMKVV
ncbi:MAG: PIN domain-containing protein [Saprospiraceae bacterium]|nr:PIN domain-containing protein [Saprospiraceae bacterium]